MNKINELAGSLLSRDGYDRWGHGSPEEKAANQEAMDREDQEIKALRDKLTDRIKGLRATDPAAVIEWASAHEALLTDFIQVKSADAEKNGTEIYVAQGELDAWGKLRKGEVSTVDQNVYYVHYNPEFYKSYFG